MPLRDRVLPGAGYMGRMVGRANITLGRLVGVTMIAASAAGAEPSWIAYNESVVVLESPQFHFDWDHRRLPMPIDLFHCATMTLHAKYPQVRIVSQSEFARRAFPNLDPGEAPVSAASLRLLANNKTLQARIASLNVRYLVYGATENDIESIRQGVNFIAGTPFLFGSGEWNKRSSYNALIIDLKQSRELQASGEATGTSWYAMLMPLFVGWKSPTEGQACDRLGHDVLALLEQASTPAALEGATRR